MKEIWL